MQVKMLSTLPKKGRYKGNRLFKREDGKRREGGAVALWRKLCKSTLPSLTPSGIRSSAPAAVDKMCHFLTRGVKIPLFPASGSGIRIQLWIQIWGWNHYTSIAVTNPFFPGSRSRIRIAIGPEKSSNLTPEPDPGPE